MKIAIIEHDIACGEKEENLITVAERLSRVEKDTDIVVLPELFSTGFISDPGRLRELAETTTGRTMDDVHRWAQFFKFAICGSYLACVGSDYYNRGFFIEPSGEESYYDKRHLFSMGEESKLYKAGNKPSAVLRYRGWNISMLVCYDLRFPVWCRNRDGKTDLTIVPACWPDARAYAWKQLLIARAIENQTYVVGGNRSGSDDYGSYTGESHVMDFQGKEIAAKEEEGILYAVLSHKQLSKYRQAFPVAKDADSFQII